MSCACARMRSRLFGAGETRPLNIATTIFTRTVAQHGPLPDKVVGDDDTGATPAVTRTIKMQLSCLTSVKDLQNELEDCGLRPSCLCGRSTILTFV